MIRHLTAALLLAAATSLSQAAEINIPRSIESVMVEHNGIEVEIKRNQAPNPRAAPAWTLTGRNCPPFCVQPLTVAPGVEPVGILEVVKFMRDELTFEEGLIIDARTSDWSERGTIPGSINIPYTHLRRSTEGGGFHMEEAFEQFGVTPKPQESGWDFSNAKKLILWCNGWWCGQSPTAIRGLLDEGYPAEKLFYFRGGMQSWQLYGLNTV